jgi:hypothetical protein
MKKKAYQMPVISISEMMEASFICYSKGVRQIKEPEGTTEPSNNWDWKEEGLDEDDC